VKVAVVGSREYPDQEEVRVFVHNLPAGTIIVSGGARGVDSWAAGAAADAGLDVDVKLPNYELLGHFAPMARNGEIVAVSDQMEAFWDGESRGTLDAIHKMLAAGKPVNVRVKRKS